MDKKSHIRIASLAFDTIFPYEGILAKLAFIYGAVEPDLNVFTYIKGHGEERIKPYIISSLKELREIPYWDVLDFYKAGRVSHYIVDSFTFPHTKEFEGNIKDHIAWEKRIARLLLAKNEITIKKERYKTFEELKAEYRKIEPSIENDIVFALSSVIALIGKAYASLVTFPVFARKAIIS